MGDPGRNREELAAELAELRQRVSRLEASEAQHRRVAQALRESEARYKTLVETSPDAVIMADLEGRITFASESTLQLHGSASPEELYGRNPLDFVAPEDHAKFLANLRRTLERGVVRNAEYTFVKKDGRRFSAETTSAAVKDDAGSPVALMALVRDVTERKQAAEQIEQSHDELRAIYRGVSDGVVVADVETKRFVRVNPAICRMLGYPEDELLSLSVMDIHPPEDLARVLEKFEAQARGDLVVAEGIPVLRKDRSVLYADITTSAVAYLGRPCSIGVFHDISRRREAQERLERRHRALRQMLRAQDRERQLVAYEIHDGLAQLLSGAIMHLQTLEQLNPRDSEQASNCLRTGLDMLGEALGEARRLIGGLRPPILDESGVVAAIAHLIHDLRDRDGLRVAFHNRVEFDRLEPILENAIFRVVQEGLANVRRHSRSDRARVRLVQQGDRVDLEVQDWGIGFDPHGVGDDHFGLMGIRERARLLGGKVAIQSTPGEGTRIAVSLPLVRSEDGS